MKIVKLGFVLLLPAIFVLSGCGKKVEAPVADTTKVEAPVVDTTVTTTIDSTIVTTDTTKTTDTKTEKK